MSADVITAKPEQPLSSLRELFSSFVRKPTKPQTQKPMPSARVRRSSYCHDSRRSDAGYWENEFTTDSFLELSSEVSPVDEDSWVNGIDDFDCKSEESITGENGNLWKDEVQRKCALLTKNLEAQMRLAPVEYHGFNLKFPNDLPQRIARKIVATASSEPCGLRGCSVYVRLLHEDVACALMNSENRDTAFVKARAERCASWPEAPDNSRGIPDGSAANEKTTLDFRLLPDLDAALTESANADMSTDSGFAETNEARRRSLRRNQQSASSSSIPALPSLSSASRLQVACADLGRLDLCDPDSVPTFEVYVYLAPATSWTWWVRKFFSSNIRTGKLNNQRKVNAAKSNRSMTLLPDFTLVKRKLYRSRSNSLQVIRCPEQK